MGKQNGTMSAETSRLVPGPLSNAVFASGLLADVCSSAVANRVPVGRGRDDAGTSTGHIEVALACSRTAAGAAGAGAIQGRVVICIPLIVPPPSANCNR